MPATYRLISGDVKEVERQLLITSLKNKEGKEPIEKPILMSTAQGDASNVNLYVIVEMAE